MRAIHSLPLVAAILLAGCGGGAEDAAADGDIGADEVAAAAAGVEQPQPGQYQVSTELLEFDIPGASESVKQQAQAMMGGATEVARTASFCLTPEDAASNGPRQMVESMAESNCTFARFDVAGGTVSADMQCTDETGVSTRVLMDGQMSATGSTMTMTTEQSMAGLGQVHMKTRIASERIGDCA